MFCKFCGKEIEDNSLACMYCGMKVSKNETVQPQVNVENSNQAMNSFENGMSNESVSKMVESQVMSQEIPANEDTINGVQNNNVNEVTENEEATSYSYVNVNDNNNSNMNAGQKFENAGARPENKAGNNVQDKDEPIVGYKMLSLFFPIAGLVLYLSNKDKKPVTARSYGMWTMIGVIAYLLIALIVCICVIVQLEAQMVGGSQQITPNIPDYGHYGDYFDFF